MSRIGKRPVAIPDKVKVAVQDSTVKIEGPVGKLQWAFDASLKVIVDDAKREVRVERPDDQRRSRALHGLTRALIANMVKGVTEVYSKTIELYGTGYSANVQGKKFVLLFGLSHPVELPIPAGIEVIVETPNTRGNETPAKFTIKGCDKQQVGEFAAGVHHLRPAEPYLGKGFRFFGEQIRRKAGKTFVTGGSS